MDGGNAFRGASGGAAGERLDDGFRRCAARAPAAPALLAGETVVTYGALESLANAGARALAERGLAPDAPVAITLDDPQARIVAILAVLRAGGAPLVLDPDTPAAVRAEIRAQAGAALPIDAPLPSAPGEAPAPPASGLAYVVHTSGSTGRPKCVAMPHAAIAPLIAWQIARDALAPGARTLACAAPAFDVSYQELFATLGAGGCLVLVDGETRRRPAALLETLVSRGVERIFVTPTLLHALAAAARERGLAPTRLAEVVVAGEALHLTPALRGFFAALPGCRLSNQYGPCETHVATAHTLDGPAAAWPERPPIGAAIAGRSVALLDARGRPVADGAEGEIWIGGVGPARSYLVEGAPAPDEAMRGPGFGAIPGRPGARAYRTGDIAVRGADGLLRFVGRRDDEVKIRGVRLALADADARLAAAPGVRAAATAAFPDGRGSRRLVGYVVLAPGGDRSAALAAIRSHLDRTAPRALRPSLLTVVDALPTTASGKLDRKALPPPRGDQGAADAPASAPGEGIEALVLAEMRRLLGAPALGPGDDFVAAGGDSLLAARLVDALAARLGRPLSLALLQGGASAEALAAALGRADDDATAAEPSPAPSAPLTALQRAYLFARDPDVPLGGVAARIVCERDLADLDPARARAALDALVARHRGLRTVVDADGRRRVLADPPGVPVAVADLRGLDAMAREARLAELRADVADSLPPAGEWPLFQIALARLDEATWRCLASVELILGDMRFLRRLARDLVALYDGREIAAPDPAPDPAPDAAPAPRPPVRTGREPPAALFPAPDLPRAASDAALTPPRMRRLSGRLAPAAWAAFQAKAAAARVTPTAALAAAYAETLARFARVPRFTLNLPSLGAGAVRHGDSDDASGVALLPLDLAEPASFATRAAAVQRALWAALAEDPDDPARPARLAAGGLQPIVFTSLLGLDLDGPEATLLGWSEARSGGVVRTPQTLIDHHLGAVGGALRFNWDVVEGAFPEGLPEAMHEAYRDLLERLAEADWTTLDARAVPDHAGAPALEPPIAGAPRAGETLAARLDDAGRDPARPALVAPGLRLDRAGLAARVAAIARACAAARVSAGDLVGIAAERGAAGPLAAIALARIGAAYLPLDLAWPADRIARVCADSGLRACLATSRAAASGVLPDGLARIPIAAADPPGAAAAPPPDSARPEALAYVITTSGSTGAPKGVAVAHRAALGTIADVAARIALGEDDRVLGVSAMGFDLSVFDIFGALRAGATLVAPDEARLRDPAALLALMREEAVTVWNSAPLVLEALVAHAEAAGGRLPASLRVVMLSGDWIPRALPARIRALAEGPVRLVSLGGATEAGIWSVWHEIGEAADPAWPSVPYGRPLGGQSALVLDEALFPRPDWVPGPLYIGGASLAEGYHRDPERTRERFVVHPRTGARLYRTGDLARMRPGGLIELLGREDRQVKILGQRVEPGEVEAALQSHPAVRAAVVTPRREGRGVTGLDVIVHVRAEAMADGPALEAALAARLRAALPAAMIPAALTLRDAPPLTANGKLDRAALAAPETAPERAPESARETSRETWRARIRAAVTALGAREAPDEASFFETGLTSLDLLRLRDGLARDAGATLSVADLFAHPSVAALAARCAAHAPAAATRPAPRPRATRGDDRAVAIVGLSCRFPGADGPESFWEALREGRDLVRRFTPDALAATRDAALARRRDYVPARPVLDGAETFDAGYFGVSPFEAERMDPQHRLMLELAVDALEHAGLAPGDALRIGVFAGANESAYLARLRAGVRQESAEGMALRVATDRDYLATRVSWKLGLTGPSLTVQTACSTSLVAVHLACQSLILGECDAALAGGVALQVPHDAGYLWQPGGYSSRDGVCRPYSADCDGTVFGSGGGLVALRRLADAIADGDAVLAVIAGSAIANDGAARAGFAAPGVDGQARTIAAALAAAGVAPARIGLVEGHGTGTPLGDPIEVAALTRAYAEAGGARNVALGSVKGNLGHLDTAAGIAGLIKLALARDAGVLPPSLHAERPNPEIGFARTPFFANARARPWPKDKPFAGLSSFGIGGTNAHAILGPAPEPATPADVAQDGPALLVLSARDPEALAASADRMAAWLRGPGRALPLPAVAACAARRRLHHPERLALAAPDASAAAEALAAWATGAPATSRVRRDRARTDAPAPVLVFPGQGAQSPGMGRGLVDLPGFAEALAEIEATSGPVAGLPLAALLTRDDAAPALARPGPALMASVAMQLGLAAAWRALGLIPAAVVGWSLGEIAAAHAAGALDLDQATRVATARAAALEAHPAPGAMAQLPLAAEAARALLAGSEARAVRDGALWLAAETAPETCLVAGAEAPMRRLLDACAARGIEARLVPNGDFASHGPAVAPAAAALEAALAGLAPTPPRIPFHGAVEGRAGETRLDARYWADNLRRPVRLAPVLADLVGAGHATFVDCAPRPMSAAPLQAAADARGTTIAVLASAERGAGRLPFLDSLARLHVAGFAPDWRALHPDPVPALRLPAYPWRRRRYRLEDAPPAPAAPSAGPSPDRPLLGARLSSPALAGTVFEARLSAQTSWLADHRVGGSVVLPFAAACEMLAAAAPDPARGLEAVEAEAPLVLDAPMRVQTVVAGDTVSLHAAPADADPPAWRRIATARIAAGPAACEAPRAETPRAETPRAETPRAEPGAGDDVPLAPLYAALAEEGVALGPDYRRLARLNRDAAGGAEGALAPAEGDAALAPARHPALLDAAILAAGHALTGSRAGGPIVPVAARRVLLVPGAAPVLCRARPARAAAPDETAADLVLLDAAGAVTGRIEGLVFRRAAGLAVSAPWLRRIAWTASEPGDGAPDIAGRSLVVAGEGPRAAALAARAAARGARVLAFDRASPAERAAAPILDLRALDARDGDDADAPCLGVLDLIRAHAEAGLRRTAPLLVVTRGAQLVRADDPAPAAGQASLWGLVRTALHEHPELALGLVDLPRAPTPACLDALLALAAGPAAPPQAALRDGRRLTPELAAVPLPNDGAEPFRTRGTWLVTGGTGGLGPHLGAWLAGCGADAVVLAGRRDPATVDLSAAGALAQRIRVRRVDAADAAEVGALLAEIDATLPPLAGVIHAALALDDRLLVDQTPASLRTALSAKLDGARVLDAATRARSLDRFVLFSSVAGTLGAPGQANYAAASAGVDAIAEARRRAGLPALAVAFGPWSYPGSPSAGRDEAGAYEAVSLAEGLDRLGRLMAAPPAAHVVVGGFAPRLARAFAPAASPATPPLARRPAPPRDAVALADDLAARVARRTGLAPAEIPRERTLAALGLDSLAVLELRNELAEDLGLVVAPRRLIAAPGLAAIAQALAGETAPADPGDVDALTDEEVARALDAVLAETAET
ncbi:amino acid adenylation domain-containing protein [Salinarimonas sp.]|uniref:amino acid adenylation domain-containing protein n=1 Tax=Salinarimonas sp. TaxID=2766526 RepID=UPI0032D90CDE